MSLTYSRIPPENSSGPHALPPSMHIPVVTHAVIKVYLTVIIDDEVSWAEQALSNFSITDWIWIPGKEQTSSNSRSDQWMNASVHWLLWISLAPSDISTTSAFPSSPVASWHIPSMIACLVGDHKLPDSLHQLSGMQTASTIMGPPPAAPSSDQHRGLYPAACLHHCTDMYGLMQFLAVPWGSGHALLQANSNINSLVPLCTSWFPCRRHKAEHNSTPYSLRRSPAQ